MAHRAFLCSDVVSGIASYLPTADVLSLVDCGCRVLNKILRTHVTYSLAYTTRDVDVIYAFWHLFKNIKYVYISHKAEFTHKIKISKQLQRFVAPNTVLRNFKFGPNVQYIIVSCAFKCSFDKQPEKYVMTLVGYYDEIQLNNDVTHIKTSSHYISVAQVELLCSRLQEITIAGCPNDIRQPTNVKVNYVCDCVHCDEKYMCRTCGAMSNAVFTNDNNFSKFDGVKHLTIDSIYEDPEYATIPPSVTSMTVHNWLDHEQVRKLAQSLPETVTDVRITTINIAPSQLAGLLLLFNDKVKSLKLEYSDDCEDVTFIIDVVVSVCRKIQFDILTIKFDDYYNYGEGDTTALASNYHLECHDNKIVFERIRARS